MGTRRLSIVSAASTLLLLALGVSATGCAAESGEDAESADSAASKTPDSPAAAEARNPAYDAVARKAKVTNKATPGEAVSAQTTLLGYIPSEKIEDVTDKLLGVRKWTEIAGEDGTKVFTAARVTGDDVKEGVRTIKANVTMDGDIQLATKVVSETKDDGTRSITITNTSSYRHWLAGEVLAPGKLKIVIVLRPYQGGVIVDANATVKLNASEDSAPSITGYVVPIFNWLKA